LLVITDILYKNFERIVTLYKKDKKLDEDIVY